MTETREMSTSYLLELDRRIGDELSGLPEPNARFAPDSPIHKANARYLKERLGDRAKIRAELNRRHEETAK